MTQRIQNGSSSGRRHGGPLSCLTLGVSGLVGLATELHAHQKAEKAASQHSSGTAAVALQVADRDAPPDHDSLANANQDSDHPPAIQPLPLPVILPQRRPNSKSRGFVRAYSPDLWYYKGISQQEFLAFLKNFHEASQASPVFQVLNIAAIGAGFAPSAIAMAVSTAVTIASTAAIEVQGRYRTNNYLNKANEELFHPNNLHCMIMTFKPEAQDHMFLNFNFDSSVFSSTPAGFNVLEQVTSNSKNTLTRKLRVSDGITEGQWAIPEAAPLIFPKTLGPDESLTEEPGSDLVSTQRPSSSSWKSTRKFVSDYKDRRAQAVFAGKHGQDSKLAVPGAANSENFASRFSDPNHPVNSGSPLALLTGGMIDGPNQIKEKLRELTGRSPTAGSAEQLKEAVSGMVQQQRQSRPRLLSGIKGMMEQDVLYLLIAEIPSESNESNEPRETD